MKIVYHLLLGRCEHKEEDENCLLSALGCCEHKEENKQTKQNRHWKELACSPPRPFSNSELSSPFSVSSSGPLSVSSSGPFSVSSREGKVSGAGVGGDSGQQTGGPVSRLSQGGASGQLQRPLNHCSLELSCSLNCHQLVRAVTN